MVRKHRKDHISNNAIFKELGFVIIMTLRLIEGCCCLFVVHASLLNFSLSHERCAVLCLISYVVCYISKYTVRHSRYCPAVICYCDRWDLALTSCSSHLVQHCLRIDRAYFELCSVPLPLTDVLCSDWKQNIFVNFLTKFRSLPIFCDFFSGTNCSQNFVQFSHRTKRAK